MAVEPQHISELRPTQEVLKILKNTLALNGPFSRRVLSSFTQAQSAQLLARMNEGESLPIKYQKVFPYDPEIDSNKELMRQLFEQKILAERSKGSVVLMDIPAITMEKQHNGDDTLLTPVDLRQTLFDALKSCNGLNKGSDDLFPIVSAHFVPKEKHTLHKIDFSNQYGDSVAARPAFMWGDTEKWSSEFTAFDALMLSLADSDYQPFTSILIPQEALKVGAGGYGSPWVTKLLGDQLRELSDRDILRTIAKTKEALVTQTQATVRVVVRPFGTGKTKMLQELRRTMEDEGVPEVTFINGAEAIEEQNGAFAGRVIFVDEAANLDPKNIVRQTGPQSVVVLYYPSEGAVKTKMPVSQWPEGSYSLTT